MGRKMILFIPVVIVLAIVQTSIFPKMLIMNVMPEAVFVLERATLLRPTVEMFCDFGVSYARTGNFDEAERCFELAVDMIPSRMLPRYRLFCLYRDKELYAKAFDVAQQILGQRVKVVNSLTLDIKREVKTFCEEYKNPGKMPCRNKGN